MDNINFNDVVKSTAVALAMDGVDPSEVAANLVARYGKENAFLLFQAAKVFLKLEGAVS